MRRTAFLVASLLVSALFLWLALRDVPLAEVLASIRQASILWIVVALISLAIGLWTRAVRWRGLLDFKIPPIEAFYIICITFFGNLLPLRAGEVARSLLATRSGVPVMTAATSIVVERLIDTLLVVVSLAVAFSQLPSIPETATRAATLFGIAAVAAFIVLLFFARYPHIAHTILARVERLLPFLGRLPL
ncbi:MAG: flippase-like domain-containing protein, partial [Acidobacteriales bacterium]|nr:flippase-like domain-containing protein [Terriglobales bacterium]